MKNEHNMQPSDFKIKAYPNPFNSTVNLQINLPGSGLTELTVYNLLGQKIKTIVNKYLTAGIFHFSYQADEISSGIYFVILKQNQLFTKEKIILLK